MAAYIGQIVTLHLKNEGGQYCGRLISHNHVDGKIVLSKVTCITTGKKLPGNRTFFQDEIVHDSMVVTDEVKNETSKMDSTTLKEKSKSIVMRGSKCGLNASMPICGDVQRETFQLAAFYQCLQRAEDPSQLPDNLITANVYQQLVELSPRDIWKDKFNKKQRPTSYVVIDKLGDCFDEAIFRIKAEASIGIAFTGMDLCRRGRLCWIQIAASDIVYLFDAFTMDHTCISYGLEQVLASPTILKVTHDCRFISDLLFHQYNVKMVNIFDTQVAAVIVYRSMNGGHYPAYVKSLQTLVEDYLPIDRNEYHVYKIRQAFRDTEEKIWSYRPMHSYLLDSLAKTVSYMNELREALIKDMMSDFYIAIDAYVSMYRDLTDEQSNSPQQDQHVLPLVFKNFQRRDEWRCRRTQSKDSENMFNSNGLVETMDNPQDIYYKRDSIMHARQKNRGPIPPTKTPRQPNAYTVPSHLQKDLPVSARSDLVATSTLPATTISSAAEDKPPADGAVKLKECSTPAMTGTVEDVCSGPVFVDSSGTSSQARSQIPNCMGTAGGSTSALSMQGVTDSKRSVVVGRGRSTTFPTLARLPAAQPSLILPGGAGRAGEDSDSGVDSEYFKKVHPEHIMNTVGCASGFQNFEKMGNAPLSIDHVPEGFDIRSASLKELKEISQSATNRVPTTSNSRQSHCANIPINDAVNETGDSDIEWDS